MPEFVGRLKINLPKMHEVVRRRCRRVVAGLSALSFGSACINTAVAAANCVVFGNSDFANSSSAIIGLTASS